MSEALADTAADVADDTDLDATAADATDVSADATAVDTDTDTAADTTADAPQIDWDSPEVQDRLAEMSRGQMQAYLEELAAQAPQDAPQAPPIPDPFSDNYQQELLDWAQHQREQTVAEIRAEYDQREHQAYVEQTIGSTLDKTAAEFKIADEDKGLLEYLANEEAHSIRARGEEGLAQATRLAAEKLIARDKRISAAAVKAYSDGVQGVGETRGEPGATGAALTATTTADSYEDATVRVLARHGIPYDN